LYGGAPPAAVPQVLPQGYGAQALGPAPSVPMLTMGSYIDPAGEGDAGNPEAAEFGGNMPPPPPPEEAVDLGTINWAQVKSAGDFKILFGKDKGKTISQVRDLSWLRGILEKDLADPDKAQFHKSSAEKLKAIYERLRNEGEVTPLDG